MVPREKGAKKIGIKARGKADGGQLQAGDKGVRNTLVISGVTEIIAVVFVAIASAIAAVFLVSMSVFCRRLGP